MPTWPNLGERDGKATVKAGDAVVADDVPTIDLNGNSAGSQLDPDT
jgi:hypothetical protein